MNTEIAPVRPCLVGKTIAHVVMKKGTGPSAQRFLVFTDRTHHEFYSAESISGDGRPYRGQLPAVLASGKPNQVVLFSSKSNSTRASYRDCQTLRNIG